MGLFQKAWAEIHGFDKMSKAEQDAMRSKMGPSYGFQLLFTVVTTLGLIWLFQNIGDISVYTATFMAWIGFVVPTQVSAALFGGSDSKWMLKKVIIQSLGSLACLLAAAFVISMF
jgi:hypothetical protein